jgi:hypothetical protein
MSTFWGKEEVIDYLKQNQLWGTEKNLVDMAADLRAEIASLMRVIHPDRSPQEVLAWTNKHVIHYGNPCRTYTSGVIDTIEINAQFLPLLGLKRAMNKRLELFDAMPRQSVRALAAQHEIDPDYAVEWAQSIKEKLRQEMEHNHPRFEINHADVGLESGHIPKSLAGAVRDRYIASLFLKFQSASDGKIDFSITPMMAELMDFPHVAKMHKAHIRHEDYGAMTKADMLNGTYYEPEAVVTEVTRFQPPPRHIIR